MVSTKYFYCPKCDEVVKKKEAGDVKRYKRSYYCTGSLGSKDHEPKKITVEDGPPTNQRDHSRNFFAITLLLAIAIGAFGWYIATLRNIQEASDLGMIAGGTIFLISLPINSHLANEKIKKRIKKKALCSNQKEKIKKIYTFDWEYSLFNGKDFYLMIGTLTVVLVAMPTLILIQKDLPYGLFIVISAIAGSGTFGVIGLTYNYLTHCTIIKLVPFKEKETKDLIKKELTKRGIDYEIEEQDYYQIGSFFSAPEKVETRERFVSDELDLEIETSKTFRGRCVAITYSRLKNKRYKRRNGIDPIESLKRLIDNYVKSY